jgi:hypothetical protein
MRILIDIGHPGHVHLFKNFAREMQSKGHRILFTCREKEFEIDLLKADNFDYISFGKKYKSISGKIKGLVIFNFKMLKVGLKFKPDIFLSVGSMYAAQVSFLLRKPHIAMEDTGNMEQVKLYLPFTKVVLTPNEISQDLGKKQFRYRSFHELAYLSPEYFTPDKNIYSFLNLTEKDKYVIIRFVAWNATHDSGQGGLTSLQKDEIINFLSSKYRLFISSEGEVPKKYEKYLIKIPPSKIHDAMAFAELVVSEGATMASESGMLGTPAIYTNSIRACNNEDLEKYGLVFNYATGNEVLKRVKELECFENRRMIFQERRKKMLTDKINITSLMVWLVDGYPESLKDIKKTPEILNSF